MQRWARKRQWMFGVCGVRCGCGVVWGTLARHPAASAWKLRRHRAAAHAQSILAMRREVERLGNGKAGDELTATEQLTTFSRPPAAAAGASQL